MINPKISGSDSRSKIGYQAGISIPFFAGAQRGQIKSAELQQQIAERNYVLQKNNLLINYQQQLNEYKKISQTLDYYENGALKQAAELLRVSTIAYNEGEIGYVEYIQNITQYVSARTQVSVRK